METVKSLYGVKATVLPARVMVLLSKYAIIVKEADGIIINLSSLNVFKHVHNSYKRSEHPAVKKCYAYLLLEVNRHLEQGNMAVHCANDKQAATISEPEFDERYETLQHISKPPTDSSISVLRTN